MSIRTITRYYVRCQACSAEFDASNADSAMAARIVAGIAGWKFRRKRQNRSGQSSDDYCPGCEVAA